MSWQCGAINNGVAIFPDGKIRPCCRVAAEYSKPIESILDNNRFQDLTLQDRPSACRVCWEAEDNGYPSPRKHYDLDKFSETNTIKYLDVRNTNLCNLKCRYCSPHFSNQIAKEFKIEPAINTADITHYLDKILSDQIVEIYFAGGEPLISRDHHLILTKLVDSELSKTIKLRYNTNFSVLEYKGTDFMSYWDKFKHVSLMVSLDAAGNENNFIRSNSSWEEVKSNIEKILSIKSKNVRLVFTPVISILNIWFLPELVEFAKQHSIEILPNLLYGPDYLSISVIPKDLKPLALEKLKALGTVIKPSHYKPLEDMLAVDNDILFGHALQHIILLDKLRDEKLFDLLPFLEHAKTLILRNYEYE